MYLFYSEPAGTEAMSLFPEIYTALSIKLGSAAARKIIRKRKTLGEKVHHPKVISPETDFFFL